MTIFRGPNPCSSRSGGKGIAAHFRDASRVSAASMEVFRCLRFFRHGPARLLAVTRKQNSPDSSSPRVFIIRDATRVPPASKHVFQVSSLLSARPPRVRARKGGSRYIKWRGRKRFVGESFVGYRLGINPKARDGWEVHFGSLLIGELWCSDQGGMRPAKYARQP